MKECPSCKKINPDNATKCDCGLVFTERSYQPDPFFQLKKDVAKTVNIAGFVFVVAGAITIFFGCFLNMPIVIVISGIWPLFLGICMVGATARAPK